MSVDILLINPKHPRNIGGTVRAVSCFGGGHVYWTGDRAEFGSRLPREERMKDYADTPYQWLRYPRPIDNLVAAHDAVPVAVELLPGSEPLNTFLHPEHAVYVFGPEDGSIPPGLRRACHRFVTIPSNHCLNLAAAVNVTLYDRMVKRVADGRQTPPSIDAEGRGVWHTPDFDELG